ncbi:hypothetical protein [Enterobacter cloacae]|uniref:hypothetical protein n=1 Tax=Enterobacter cloacae TaxID=550 RepID=UPI002074CE04|nr:hypothetical protein [Enterobacter cloacae]MCM7404460.1 hypothetical protein [Enterobacter cloacae]
MSTITTERLTKILSETQAVITECNSRGVHGSVEVNASLFENVLMELLRHRAAMLQGAEPVTTAYKLPEGWVAVPVNATRAMIDAAARVEEDGYDAMHKAMIAAAPQQEVK